MTDLAMTDLAMTDLAMTDFRRRWTGAWASLGLPASDAWLARLLGAYAEPTRHYHTLQHLSECLDLFGQVAALAERPGEVAVALWFHDAVYVPLAHDNEERSAAWASRALMDAGAGADVVARVRALILATARHAATDDRDTRLVLDIDLAILAAQPERFAQYERQVRSEYAAVEADVYARKRGAVLAGFLARPAIYQTPGLHARLEARARANLLAHRR